MNIVQLEDPHLSPVDLTTALKTVFFCWHLLMLGSRMLNFYTSKSTPCRQWILVEHIELQI